eukprot:g8588.t1
MYQLIFKYTVLAFGVFNIAATAPVKDAGKAELLSWGKVFDYWKLDKATRFSDQGNVGPYKFPNSCRENPCLYCKMEHFDDSRSNGNCDCSYSKSNGVECQNNVITKLNLGDIMLRDKIPISLFNLTSLTNLCLPMLGLNGKIMKEVGKLSQLSSITLYNNNLTGVIPFADFAKMKHLTSIHLGSNKFSGSITKEIGQLKYLDNLRLSDNLLSGEVPLEIGSTNIGNMDLSNNRLTGKLPLTLLQLPLFQQQIGTFDISYNQFDYPPHEKIMKRCLRFGSLCIGMPPQSCTAFSGKMALSVDMRSCVSCEGNIWITIFLFIFGGIGIYFLARYLTKIMAKYPNKIGETIASISIVTSHAQMMSVVFLMDLSWPSPVKERKHLLHGFFFDLPSLVSAECIFVGMSDPAVAYVWATLLLFCILLYTLSMLPSLYGKICMRGKDQVSVDEKIDKLYYYVSLIMSHVASKVVNVILGSIGSNVIANSVPAFIIFCLCVIALPTMLFNFYREMRVLQGKWDGGWWFLKPIALPKNRLERRLIYLTKRFDEHAPYWQFVLWARQLPLTIFLVYVENIWAIGIFAILVCVVSFILHNRVKPFKYEFQNLVDSYLMLSNVVIIIAAVLYSEIVRPEIVSGSSSAVSVFSVLLTVIILIAMFGSLLWCIIYLRLWIGLWNSLMKMWGKDPTADVTQLNDIEVNDVKENLLLQNENESME